MIADFVASNTRPIFVYHFITSLREIIFAQNIFIDCVLWQIRSKMRVLI